MAQELSIIATGTDDGHLAMTPNPDLWWNALNVIQSGANIISAFRFDNLSIPNGVTVTSAFITVSTSSSYSSNASYLKIYGIDEDDTTTFSSDPTGRDKTTANVDWDLPSGTDGFDKDYVTSDVSSIVEEIVNRGGWISGNALGFFFEDDGSSFDQSWKSFETDDSYCARLEVNYTGASPSASPSPSGSPSSSVSPSPSPEVGNYFGLKVAKPGENALLTQDPSKLIFDSTKGTLKYYTKQAIAIEIDGSNLEVAATGSYTHDLGYYPFVEVFVAHGVGSHGSVYEYCPFHGSGASVFYNASLKITTTKIHVYAGIFGEPSASTWYFDFLVFIFKNDLHLLASPSVSPSVSISASPSTSPSASISSTPSVSISATISASPSVSA